MKTKMLGLMMIFLISFAGCKKSDDKASATLTSKTWKRALVDKNVSTNPVTTPIGRIVYSAFQDCEEDDTYKFGLDGKLIINRGVMKCDDSEEQVEVKTYSFNPGTQQLVINGEPFFLLEQSKNQLKYYALIAANGLSAQYLIFIFE